MKRSLFLLFLPVLMTVSCGPSQHAVHVEMRYPSKSGIELSGKVVSVIYVLGDEENAGEFSAAMADGFAYALETDYATGEGSVGVYSIQDEGGRYSHKDTLVNLLMDTGADAVFLFDRVSFQKMDNNDLLKYSIRLHCFDAMNPSENVYTFAGSSIAETGENSLQEVGWEAGMTVAGSFKSQWKHEQYSIVFYDKPIWYNALEKADSYQWKQAMDIWLALLDTNDPLKRSSAEYNIAVACYMLGDYILASEWLDLSDKDNRLPLSDGLRKRIDARK